MSSSIDPSNIATSMEQLQDETFTLYLKTYRAWRESTEIFPYSGRVTKDGEPTYHFNESEVRSLFDLLDKYMQDNYDAYAKWYPVNADKYLD